VAVEDFELDTSDSITSNSTASSTNLLAKIPSSVPVGTTLAYQDYTTNTMYAMRHNLSSVRIELLDERQRPYELLGVQWSCCIEMEIL
jgi:hypothetical protein